MKGIVMQSDFLIVRQDQFIKATRDSGYKGTDSALSELIDNSIQAGASCVNIRMVAVEQEQTGPGRRPMPRVVEVAIADCGRGMDASLLRRAVRFGDSNRFEDRNGLGRFGMGLPNASVSQCQRFEVYTWQNGSKPMQTYIDVNEIAKGDVTEVPEPVEAPIPAPYEDLVDPQQGTLVVWKNCDRLDHDRKLETLERTLRPSLGRIFRHYLAADFKIILNDKEIEPFDPMYLMPIARLKNDKLATQHGDTIKFRVPVPGEPDRQSTVEVLFSLLPEEWQSEFKRDKKQLQRRHIESSRGFSLVRSRREVDLIKSPYHAKHWTDSWYRVEIRFDPELDEVFNVTHTKQHASIKSGSSIYEKLREAITGNVNTMKDMIVARGKKAHQVRTKAAEDAVKKVEPRLKPVEEIDNKPDSQVNEEIKSFIEQRNDQPAANLLELEERLSSYSVVIEYESLVGAPFYRAKIVGRTIVVLINTHHKFYDQVYRRIEAESPIGKTGIDLLLMSLARSEAVGTVETRAWYEDQRHEWSQHVKAFVEQLNDGVEEDELDFENATALMAD